MIVVVGKNDCRWTLPARHFVIVAPNGRGDMAWDVKCGVESCHPPNGVKLPEEDSGQDWFIFRNKIFRSPQDALSWQTEEVARRQRLKAWRAIWAAEDAAKASAYSNRSLFERSPSERFSLLGPLVAEEYAKRKHFQDKGQEIAGYVMGAWTFGTSLGAQKFAGQFIDEAIDDLDDLARSAKSFISGGKKSPVTANGAPLDAVPSDRGKSMKEQLEDAAVERRGRAGGSGGFRFPSWKKNDPITKVLPDGSYPSWDTIRERYWMNRSTAGFDPRNAGRMEVGLAPKVRILGKSRKTGVIEEVLASKDIHHARGNRGKPGFDSPLDLREVWPWEHEKLDKQRVWTHEFIDYISN